MGSSSSSGTKLGIDVNGLELTGGLGAGTKFTTHAGKLSLRMSAEKDDLRLVSHGGISVHLARCLASKEFLSLQRDENHGGGSNKLIFSIDFRSSAACWRMEIFQEFGDGLGRSCPHRLQTLQ